MTLRAGFFSLQAARPWQSTTPAPAVPVRAGSDNTATPPESSAPAPASGSAKTTPAASAKAAANTPAASARSAAVTPRAAAKPAAADAPAPHESRLRIAHQRGMATIQDWNDHAGTVFTGLSALGGGTLGLASGILGGMIVGGLFGLSTGPALAILHGVSGFGIVGSTLATAGTAARIAIVGGSITGAFGGGAVGAKLSHIPIGMLAYPIGFVKGLFTGDPGQAPDPQPPKPASNWRPGAFTRGAQGLLGGLGLATGGAGGMAIGAGSGAGAGLLTGLIQHTLTWTSFGGFAGAGALAGALVLGGLSCYGGNVIATRMGQAGSFLKNKVMPDKVGVEIEQRRAEVAAKQAQFEVLGAAVKTDSDAARASFNEQEAKLEKARDDSNLHTEKREAEVSAATQQTDQYVTTEQKKLDDRQALITAADQHVEAAINEKRDSIFADLRKPVDDKYAALNQQLDGVQTAQQKRDDDLTQKEKAQAASIESQVQTAYGDKIKPVEAHYSDLMTAQDKREGQLSQWSSQISSGNAALDQQIASEGRKDFESREPGLRQQYADKETQLRADYRDKTAQADQQASRDLDALATQHQSDMRALDDRFAGMTTALQAQQAQLLIERQGLQGDLSSAELDLDSARRERDRSADRLRDAESQRDRELADANAQLQRASSDRDTAQADAASEQQQLDSARADRDRYVQQKAELDAQIPGLIAQRDELRRELGS